MKRLFYTLALIGAISFSSCNNSNDVNESLKNIDLTTVNAGARPVKGSEPDPFDTNGEYWRGDYATSDSGGAPAGNSGGGNPGSNNSGDTRHPTYGNPILGKETDKDKTSYDLTKDASTPSHPHYPNHNRDEDQDPSIENTEKNTNSGSKSTSNSNSDADTPDFELDDRKPSKPSGV
ncbi:hypothetical protein [Aureibacter tunicatorum]|uniref:Lipoprotein n=1 Tax=Aureibacter tunicatorum TaxID=866807 RepID=A0AAE3XNL1_9BACT|nr:hypothetical protein [Aureibacter tunicatorum]MDR6239767.1 hypothetical protein [Aureibacter tunicatorum]BDD04242.1 hypothetical protein AUTU_17250 [Aureibacter tunicatorum]